jgi:tetratricopeptide (TPR) repeat protein
MAGRRIEGEDGPPSLGGIGETAAEGSAWDQSALGERAEDLIKRPGQEASQSIAASGPLALMSLSAFWAGDFPALDELLATAPAFVGTGPWPDEIAAQVVFQRSLGAVLASLRGNSEEAERGFLDALALSGGQSVDEARVIAYSMRAAFASDGLPDRALNDVGRARELSTAVGNSELAAVTSIGEGWALSELGQLEEAASVLQDATKNLPDNLGRSVAQLRLAEVELMMGDRVSARSSVDMARESFLKAEARYWGARAALLTGAIDRDRGGRWLKLARELALPDPAYERLFLPEGMLSIDLSAKRSVRRDGVPVVFLTRHAEAAVRLLAMSGPEGMSVQRIAEIFWPGVTLDRQRPRLRTLLWQARNSLGADAWRVQRQHDLVVFDTSGVDVIGSITATAIAAEFSSRRSPSR